MFISNLSRDALSWTPYADFDPFASFFGGGGGGGFSFFGGEQHGGERETPKGGDVLMDLDVTLEELYNGDFVQVVRYKPVKKAASGTRKCNCHLEMRTQSLGPGRFQMSQVEVCDDCPNVKYVLFSLFSALAHSPM